MASFYFWLRPAGDGWNGPIVPAAVEAASWAGAMMLAMVRTSKKGRSARWGDTHRSLSLFFHPLWIWDDKNPAAFVYSDMKETTEDAAAMSALLPRHALRPQQSLNKQNGGMP